jgi:hypothetical protein
VVVEAPLGGTKKHHKIDTSYSNKELDPSNNYDTMSSNSKLVTMSPSSKR